MPTNTDPSNPPALARGLGMFVFVASLLSIFFAATFPFDFGSSGTSSGQRFDWRWNPYDPHYVDRIQNIILFLPFGFGLASLIQTRRAWSRALLRVGGGLVMGTIFSMTVETLQIFVSFRDPSLADIWCNGLGGGLGAAIFALIGDPMLLLVASGLLRLRAFARPMILTGVLLFYCILQLTAPLLIRRPGDLSGWSRDMPLVAGNEPTGDRPWSGRVHEIILIDRASSPPWQMAGESLLAHYLPRGNGPYPDISEHLPPLSWATTRPGDLAKDAAPAIDPEHWLQTATNIDYAINRIAGSSEFTFAATVATADQNQRGPAKIVSISADPRDTDVQFGQEFADLSVRVRTAVRYAPDLYVRNVFSDTNPHELAVTHRDGRITIYIDGQQRGQIDITPEAKVIWRLYPRGGFRLWVDKYGLGSYALIYRLMVFIPFAALLAATLKMSRGLSPVRKGIVAVSAVIAMTAALEIALKAQSNRAIEISNLGMSLAIGLGTLGLLVWCDRLMKNRGVQVAAAT